MLTIKHRSPTLIIATCENLLVQAFNLSLRDYADYDIMEREHAAMARKYPQHVINLALLRNMTKIEVLPTAERERVTRLMKETVKDLVALGVVMEGGGLHMTMIRSSLTLLTSIVRTSVPSAIRADVGEALKWLAKTGDSAWLTSELQQRLAAEMHPWFNGPAVSATAG